MCASKALLQAAVSRPSAVAEQASPRWQACSPHTLAPLALLGAAGSHGGPHHGLPAGAAVCSAAGVPEGQLSNPPIRAWLAFRVEGSGCSPAESGRGAVMSVPLEQLSAPRRAPDVGGRWGPGQGAGSSPGSRTQALGFGGPKSQGIAADTWRPSGVEHAQVPTATLAHMRGGGGGRSTSGAPWRRRPSSPASPWSW